MPEPIKIAFRSFLNIENPGTYAEPDESLLPQARHETLVGQRRFNFTEWWKLAEGEKLSKPFNVGEEMVAGLLHALEVVSTLFYIYSLN